jgi:iron(III) transport system permease protein
VADGALTRGVSRLAAAALVAAVIGWPVARLFGVAFERGVATVVETLTGPQAAPAIWNSLWTGAVVAVLAVTAGTVAALLTERSPLPGRRWLRAGLLLPLLVPPFVTAFGWARAFGPRGLTDQVLGIALPGLYGPFGIVVVLTVAATPLAYLVVAAALASRVEPDLERAARASGATWFEALRTVTLPLLRPALLSALVVVFVFAINAFGVPAVLGTPAGFATITTRLYQDLALSADPAAFVRATTMAATLVIVALIVVGSADALLVGRGAARTAMPPGSAPTGGPRVAAVALGAAIVMTTILPLVALVLAALTRATGLDPVPANWTLDNFASALDSRFLGGLAHSLVLAVAAASLVLVLGSLGVAARRGRSRVLGTAITLGFAVPGSALAVAVLLAYGGWLRDTLAIILVAYVAKFWALGHRQLAGSVDRLPGDLVRAARASGAGAVDAFRSVVVPTLRPSIVAAWLIVFVFALHELTMSSLLYGPGNATLAVIVLNVQQLGDPTITAAMAVLLVGVVGVAAIPLALVGVGREPEGRRHPAGRRHPPGRRDPVAP